VNGRLDRVPGVYLMESAAEAERLEAKTNADESRRQLLLAGLAPGMRALDAGAGTGAVARVMCSIVGGEGAVVALDGSRSRIERGEAIARAAGIANLSFVEAALEAPPDPEGAFDFVWCRFVFEYLADADSVLDNLVRYARAGGKVVVADVDGALDFHYPASPELLEGIARITRALQGRYDPHAGRKIFARMRKSGLSSVRVHVMPYHLYAGSAPEADMENWAQKFETIRDAGIAAFGSADAYERFAHRYLDHLLDPDTFSYSTLILVEGIRGS
jgi:ubiquinone/menaquinone biosynthesis C-methylase UbiE